MKWTAIVTLFFAFALTLSAADSARSKTRTGKLSVATLLATQRISGNGAPDGVRFLFMVARTPGTTGQFTLKECRDFLVNGESYRETTRSKIGKEIEPATVFDTAEAFFTKQPGARRLAPPDIRDAYVLVVSIGGAELESGAKGEITLQVGFGKEVEPFAFNFLTPPTRPTHVRGNSSNGTSKPAAKATGS